jgi:hypothetical protein
MLSGKGAMVWQLRNWVHGDPVAQAEHATALGLDWVSIKVIDGPDERWRDGSPNGRHNADLLPMAVAAIRGEGIEVAAWGWTYGGWYVWKNKQRIFVPSKDVARKEGLATVDVLRKYGIVGFQVDAEKEYRKAPDQGGRAQHYSLGLETNPRIHSLCSYRFPLSQQPEFPVRTFGTYMEHFSPQVYWEGDNRPLGGALQLVQSVQEYRRIGPQPITPIGPAYKGTGGWRPTKGQLMAFFAKARELNLEGVGLFALDLAQPHELEALGEFQWAFPAPPPIVMGPPCIHCSNPGAHIP